jgi:hypothetical protein
MVKLSLCAVILMLVVTGCGGMPDGGDETVEVRADDLERAALSLPASLANARPVAPLSASIAASRRPIFRWAGPRVALFQVCADRACARTLQVFIGANHVARPPRPLPEGVAFWRMLTSASRQGLSFSPPWALFVPGGSADVPSATRGLRYDANGDGFVDAAVREMRGDLPEELLHVFAGASGGLSSARDTVLPLGQGQIGLAAAGDLNGDGFGELWVQDARGSVLFAGSVAGVVATPMQVLPTSVLGSFTQLAAGGDVNGDGYGDVFIADGSGRVALHLGSATGLSMTPAWALDHVASGRRARLLAAADVDGNGFGDLVVIEEVAGTPASQGLRVFRSGPAGLEAPDGGRLIARPSFIERGTAGDFDGDGIIDIVSVEFDGTWAIFRGRPGGPGTSPDQTLSLDPAFAVVQSGDFDDDGRFDVAALASVQTSNFFFTDDRIAIFRGQPGGLAASPSTTLAETDTLPDNQLNFGSGLGSGDFDGDGFEDLLVGAAPPFPTPFFETTPGAAFVFRGAAAGVQPAAATRLDGLPGFGIRVTAGAPQSIVP